MKYALFLFVLAISLTCKAQSQYEINLSKNLNDVYLGVWVKGDYKIYVALDKIVTNLRWTCQSSENSILYFTDKDSNLVNYYKATLKRYQKAIGQIDSAKCEFDLQTLVVYNGIEDSKQNIGNSSVVESEVKRLVELGNAIVFYKGARIYTLKSKYELKEGAMIMNRGYEIRTYFDDPENCIFTEYVHMGW